MEDHKPQGLTKYPHPDLEIFEDIENQKLYVVTDKRAQRILVTKSNDNHPFWKIKYEDGQQIKGLDGVYTSLRNAVTAINGYLAGAKVSKAKLHNDLFGPIEDRPVLKRKKVPNAASNSENS